MPRSRAETSLMEPAPQGHFQSVLPVPVPSGLSPPLCGSPRRHLYMRCIMFPLSQ